MLISVVLKAWAQRVPLALQIATNCPTVSISWAMTGAAGDSAMAVVRRAANPARDPQPMPGIPLFDSGADNITPAGECERAHPPAEASGSYCNRTFDASLRRRRVWSIRVWSSSRLTPSRFSSRWRIGSFSNSLSFGSW